MRTSFARICWMSSCVVLAVLALTGVAPGSGSGQTGSRSAAMFRGGGAQLGVVNAAGVPNLGTIAWRFDTGSPVRSSPVLLDGVVYVGNSDHHLYAVDAATGNQIWRFAADAAISSAPAADAARVFVSSRAGTVFAVARDSGELLWRIDAGAELPLPWGPEGWDYFTASPTLAGNLVLAGAGDGRLRAIDADTGVEQWNFNAQARIRTTPAVVDGQVLIGASNGILYALDLATGSEQWRFETAGHAMTAAEVGFDRTQIYSSVAVRDGVAYFGSRDALLYAINVNDGSERWRSGDGTAAWVISSPAVTSDRVFSARSSSTLVRSLDIADGSEVWSFTAGSTVFSSPVVARDTVYVGLGSGTMLALDAADGTMRWRYRTGGAIWGTPEVAGDRVFIGSDDGYLYAFAAPVGASPRLAVYSEDELPFNSQVGPDAQQRIRNYFETRAYEVLDNSSIAGFLRERIADRAPSVVVFAADYLPEVAIGGDATPLFRRYLEAGGKIVWMGVPPGFYVFDEQAGQVAGVDLEGAGGLLGIDLSDYRTDVYPVAPTATGANWGLTSSWVGNGGFPAAEASEVLALDELGRVAAFARSYGGSEGTGWVHLPIAVDTDKLDEIRAVAEYGVMRTPPPGRE